GCAPLGSIVKPSSSASPMVSSSMFMGRGGGSCSAGQPEDNRTRFPMWRRSLRRRTARPPPAKRHQRKTASLYASSDAVLVRAAWLAAVLPPFHASDSGWSLSAGTTDEDHAV